MKKLGIITVVLVLMIGGYWVYQNYYAAPGFMSPTGKWLVAQEPQWVDQGDLPVIGMQLQTTRKNCIMEINNAFGELMKRADEIQGRIDNKVLFGVYDYMDRTGFNENTPFTYMICMGVNNTDSVPQGMTGKTIPAVKYAVFTHKGPYSNIGNSYSYIYQVWLPKSGKKVKQAESFESYDDRFKKPNDPDSQVDIYIPVEG